jgi:NFU1 iron-sulfur cluster scaffold homolog, mitochondrial
VANDGGNIDLIEFNPENKTAYMVLRGACSGCPSSTATLKSGIQGLLNDMLPGVVENVEAVNG